MSYDNLTKILAEKYPERFATWLLGTPQTNVEILKTELSIEPIRADSLTFLRTLSRILPAIPNSDFDNGTRQAGE